MKRISLHLHFHPAAAASAAPVSAIIPPLPAAPGSQSHHPETSVSDSLSPSPAAGASQTPTWCECEAIFREAALRATHSPSPAPRTELSEFLAQEMARLRKALRDGGLWNLRPFPESVLTPCSADRGSSASAEPSTPGEPGQCRCGRCLLQALAPTTRRAMAEYAAANNNGFSI